MTSGFSTGLRRVASGLAPEAVTDGELLDRFLRHRDEAAFAALVRRHATMVFGTCRRVLGNAADADDAFQAAFVVLARRAAGLTDRVSVGNFLYGVTVRTALKAKAMAAKRRAKEAEARPAAGPGTDPELLRALDEELAKLPDRYREAVVLCELEGRSRRDGAAVLGIPEGTISSRLATAHRMLEKRLKARGFAVAGASALLADQGLAVPAELTEAAVRAVVTGPSPVVAKLVLEVTRMLLLGKLKLGAAAGLAALVIGIVGVAAVPQGRATGAWPSPQQAGEKKTDPGKVSSDEPAWKKEFREAYGLKAGEILKRVVPPFPACRVEYLKSIQKVYFPGIDSTIVALNYRWNDQKVEFWRLHLYDQSKPVGWPLIYLINHLGVPYEAIEISDALRPQYIPGEFILRTGTTAAKSIPALEKILRTELDLPVRMKFETVERDVIVAKGKYASKPLEDRKKDTVDLFATERNPDAGSVPGSGSFDEFLENTGAYIRKRIVNEVADAPKQRIVWFSHNSTAVSPGPDLNRDPDSVLAKVAEQTGLTFEKAKRKVRVLTVTKDE